MEGEMNTPNEPGLNGAKNILNQGQRAFEETKRTVGRVLAASVRDFM